MSKPDTGASQPDKPADSSADFLATWNKSLLGRLPSVRFPVRGLKGVGVIAGASVAVGALVFGGVAAVSALADGDPQGSGEDTSAVLASKDLATTAPTTATGTPTVAASATSSPTGGKIGGAAQTQAGSGATGSVRTVTEAAGSPGATPSTGTGSRTATTKAKKSTTTAAATTTAKTVVSTATSSVGVIRNLGNDLCVDLTGRTTVAENVVVQQHTCVSGSGDNQMFQTVSTDNGSTFLLRNVVSQWCLDVNGSGSVDANIVVNTHTCLFGSQDNQMFRKQSTGSGFYLVNVKSGLCMGVSYADDGEDDVTQPLILATCGDSGGRDVWSFG